MARSFRLARLLEGVPLDASHTEMLEHIPDPALQIDAFGKILAMNGPARTLQKEAFFGVGKHGHLAFKDERAQRVFDQELFKITTRNHEHPPQNFLLHNAAERAAMGILAPITQSDRRKMPEGFLSLFAADRPVALLIIRPAPNDMISRLKNYGLTQAELGVALALSDGKSPADHAESLGISVHTVRNQLRVVFDKLDVRRQAELVAKLHKMR
jgi:DNA-binding CsgD family transcriptional regulator